MKLCRTCRYGSEYELDKPCIVYREDCPLYEKEGDEMTNNCDLISRQAVLDAMSETWKHICYVARRRKPTKSEEAVYSDMVGTIKQLPTVNPQEPKWIPVSERLPEKNVWVLVTVVQGSGWYIEIMRIDKYKGMFTDNIDYYDSIIAWMPLPKPYEPQESEEV